MTTTSLRATVRRRINQTDNSNTQFADAMIDELGDQARRMFAALLPEEILSGLRATASLSPSTGVATYPSDYLRSLRNPRVLVDSVWAAPIPDNEKWRLRHLESHDQIKSGSANKYWWESDNGVQCLPTSATTITYPYIKYPPALSGSADTSMPADVDDMVIDFVFEKLMGTRRGDKELALFLAQSRGILKRDINQKEIGV